MIQVTQNDVDAINKLSISTLNAPPGSMFQTYFLNEMINGATIVDVTHELVISSGFQTKFPDSDANDVFASKFIAQLVGGYAPADGVTWAANHLTDLLNGGMTRPEAIVAITNEIDTATNADMHWGLAADLFHNRVILSSFYSGNPAHATDVDGMNRAMALITPDANSIFAAENSIDIPTTTVSIIGNPVMTEGGNAIYTVSRFGDLSVTTTVDFTLTGSHGADGSDFGMPSDAVNGLALSASNAGGTIIFPAFTSIASFVVPIMSDKLAEAGEKLTVALVSNTLDTFSLLSPTQNTVSTTLLDVAKKMKLKGDATDNMLTGNNGNDIIKGLAGNDTLMGGEGKDTLSGGAGHDVFKYLSVTEGGDIITDFGRGDVLQFSQAAFGTVAGLELGALTADHLLIGDHKVSAEDHTQQFIYDSATHNLYFDADASSGLYFSVLIATFTNNASLSASSFALIA